jgi:hypothetical protein
MLRAAWMGGEGSGRDFQSRSCPLTERTIMPVQARNNRIRSALACGMPLFASAIPLSGLACTDEVGNANFRRPPPEGEHLGTAKAALTIQANSEFCQKTAVVDAVECTTDTVCQSGLGSQYRCSRTWNRDLEYMWTSPAAAPDFGHCMDVTGGAAANAAIQADLCALPDPPTADGSYAGMGVPYRLPPASVLRLSDIGIVDPARATARPVGITIFRRVILDGAGAVLVVPSGATNGTYMIAINVLAPDTGAYANGAHTASWSTIQNLGIRPSPVDTRTRSTGVMLHAHGVRLTNLHVNNVGTCIDLDDPPEGAQPAGGTHGWNGNHAQWENLILTGCRTYAAYLHGQDANGGFYRGIETGSGVGIRDSAFLLSTWIGTTSEDNGSATNDPSAPAGIKHSISLENAQSSTVVGAYIEVGDPAPVSTGAALWVGGHAVKRLDSKVERIGYGRSRLVFADTSNDTGYRVAIPGQLNVSSPTYAIEIQDRTNDTYSWRFKRENGMWGFWDEGGQGAAISWKSSNTTSERGKFTLGRKALPESGHDCCDGIDNDANGVKDCADPSCAGVSVCGCPP